MSQYTTSSKTKMDSYMTVKKANGSQSVQYRIGEGDNEQVASVELVYQKGTLLRNSPQFLLVADGKGVTGMVLTPRGKLATDKGGILWEYKSKSLLSRLLNKLRKD